MTKAALLIDAENFSYKHVNQMFIELEKKSINLTLKLAFADWSQNNLNTLDWKKTLNKQSIRPQHLFNFSSGKNASDIQMVIHAMKLLYTDPDIDTFIIATSDGDFTPLVLTLKENGKKVIGFGNAVSSQILQESCDEYYLLQIKQTEEIKNTKSTITSEIFIEDINQKIKNIKNENKSIQPLIPNYVKIQNILLSIWEQCVHDEFGWVRFEHINRITKKAYPNFSHQLHGYESIKELIQDQKTFEMIKNDKLNHSDYYFRPRKKISDLLIEYLDKVYFTNFKLYSDENWLHISEFNNCLNKFDIKSLGFSDFNEVLNNSYLYDVRFIKGQGTFFRRKMTKDLRHILLRFINAWHDIGEKEKDQHGYIPITLLTNYIIKHNEPDFCIKKYKINSLVKTLKSLYSLDIIYKENSDKKVYYIKPKYSNLLN